MANTRIVVTAAVLLAAVSGAAAQSAIDVAPGKPIPLLQILAKPAKMKPHHHLRIAYRHAPRFVAPKFVRRAVTKKRRLAATAEHLRSAPIRSAVDTSPANVWPQPNSSPAATAAAANIWPQANDAAAVSPGTVGTAPDNRWPQANAPVVADAGAVTLDAASAPADSGLKEIVVGGQTVQVDSPDKANAIDLAAARPDVAEHAALKTDATQPKPAVPATEAVLTASRDAGDVGTAAWIAKVLAALGGAIATGSAAWFLIGSVPRQTYG